MSDLFKLSGDYTTSCGCNTSGVPQVAAPISETLALAKKTTSRETLTTDSPVAVSLNGLTSAHVVVIKTIGGKVRVRLTSSDGATQAIPVDSFCVLISQSVPVTAIDLTRVTGRSTTVEVFLGEIG